MTETYHIGIKIKDDDMKSIEHGVDIWGIDAIEERIPIYDAPYPLLLGSGKGVFFREVI